MSDAEHYAKYRSQYIRRATEWNKRNKDRRKEIKDKWRANNKERTNFLTRRYIYRRKNAGGSVSFGQEKEIYASFPICPYCNTNPSDTIDHIIPLSKEGTNEESNLIACCRSCNSKKGNKNLLSFRPFFYLAWYA